MEEKKKDTSRQVHGSSAGIREEMEERKGKTDHASTYA